MKINWAERLWINSPLRVLVQRREIEFLRRRRHLPPGAKVLEIGCGRGIAAVMISERFHTARVDALDIDPAMIELARRRYGQLQGKVNFLVADAQALPYPDACLDAVFNFGIIHHLEDWQQGVNEIARVLKVGGGFYFEEIYPPLYANPLFRLFLDHPRENRFHGPEYRAALATAALRLLPGYRESIFGILGVAEKERQ